MSATINNIFTVHLEYPCNQMYVLREGLPGKV